MEKLELEATEDKERKYSTIITDFFGESYTANFYNVAFLHEMVILPSFHRCGNTLILELLEGVTNIVTGSDDHHLTPYSRHLPTQSPANLHNIQPNQSESVLKFKGQWIIDQSIWVYKTHYPARKGKGLFEFDKILLIVRNPFDALDSMFNLYLTNSHSKSITKDEYERLFHDWEGLVKEEIHVWNNFYKFWYKFYVEHGVKMYIVRYEDLISDTKKEMMEVLKFLLDYRTIEGTFIEKSLDDYLKNRRLVYKPRKGTSLHSLENFTRDQIVFILENSIEMFYLFEYDIYFEDLIKEYKLELKFEEFLVDKKKQGENMRNNLDFGINRSLERLTEINRLELNKCKNEKYPYEFVHIPGRKNEFFTINSETDLIKYCENHRSGGRMARLSNIISKNVKIEADHKYITREHKAI